MAEIASLRARLAEQAPSAAASSPPATVVAAPPGGAHGPTPFPRSLPKLATPPSYDGRAEKLEQWSAIMRQQFAYYGLSDAQQVQFAGGCLQGSALHWWQSVLTQAAAPTTWSAMDAALRSRFQPVTSAEIAMGELFVITQGKQSVHAYIDRFRSLLARVPSMDEVTRTQLFIKGLKPELARLIRMYGIAGLSAVMDAAARMGSADAAVAAIQTPTSSSLHAMHHDTDADTTDGAGPATRPDAPVTRAELQQLLNAMREERKQQGAGTSSSEGKPSRRTGRGLPRIPHLSPNQVQEYMDSGKCFGCGATEHRSRECPRRQVGEGGRVSWGN